MSTTLTNQMLLMRRGGLLYANKVLDIQPANLIAYWLLSEKSGTVADNAEGTAARDGTYTNVTLANQTLLDGVAPHFDPTALSRVNVYSTSLNSAFNGNQLTVCGFAKVNDAGVWSDGVHRNALFLWGNASDGLYIRKYSSGPFYFERRGAGNIKAVSIAGLSYTDWFHFAVIVDLASDEMRVFINGQQEGSTQTGIGSWSADLSTSQTVIGASTSSGVQPWHGWLGHVPVWNTNLNTQQLAIAANVLPPGVLLQFDDGRETSYTEGFAYMQAKGISGTSYISTDVVGGVGSVTVAQLQEMNNAGWDIANHSIDGTDLTTLSQAQVESYLSTAKTALDGWGLTRASNHVAYPGGARNATTDAAMSAVGMLTGRVVGASDIKFRGLNSFIIPGRDSGNNSLATVQGWITNAQSQGYHVIVLFHGLVSSSPISTEWLISDFRDLVDWIVSQGYPTYTITDLYAAI